MKSFRYLRKKQKQEGNFNIDNVQRAAIVTMNEWRKQVLSSGRYQAVNRSTLQPSPDSDF